MSLGRFEEHHKNLKLECEPCLTKIQTLNKGLLLTLFLYKTKLPMLNLQIRKLPFENKNVKKQLFWAQVKKLVNKESNINTHCNLKPKRPMKVVNRVLLSTNLSC